MDIIKALLAELQQEGASTRKMLERIPTEKFGYKPHEKSTPMGRLAAHIAEIPGYIAAAINTNELDLAARKPSTPPATTEELLQLHEQSLAAAKAALESANEELLMKSWKIRMGDHVIAEMPKATAIRTVAKNHMIHHRGQLSVYLRLNDIPLPGIYGPSADEQ